MTSVIFVLEKANPLLDTGSFLSHGKAKRAARRFPTLITMQLLALPLLVRSPNDREFKTIKVVCALEIAAIPFGPI
jgi:hypothetical protein